MFADFLLRKLQEYETSRGRRATMAEFADYLGIKRPILSLWMLGRNEPSLESARQLAAVLGPELYTALGVTHPDPLLEYVTRNWERLSPETQRQISEQIEQYLANKKSPEELLQDPE